MVMFGKVNSPNHTFFLGKLDKALNQYFVQILSLDHRNYFTIKLQGSMGVDLATPGSAVKHLSAARKLPTALHGPIDLHFISVLGVA